jgi:hypothetical protein
MARSPLRSRPTSKSPSRAKSPKSAMAVKNEFNCYIRWMLVLAVVAIFVVCLVMYLKNYKAVRAVVDTNLGFHSTFLYETWFVIPMLILVCLCLLYIVWNIKCFSFPVLALFIIVLVFFTIMFIQLYHDVPTDARSSPQIMAFVAFIAAVVLLLLVVRASSKPVASIFCMIPFFVFTGMGIYLGGKLNGTWV